MKTRSVKMAGVAGLMVLSLFAGAYLSDLEPQPVLPEEAFSAQAADLNNQGVALYKHGSVREALSNFIIASEIDHTFWQGHYNCAVALIALGNPAEAMHHLRMSIEIDPENPVSRRLYQELLWEVEVIA